MTGWVCLLMGLVSALYATAGQAGGSGFVAVMTLTTFPPSEIRATAFALNIVASSYAMWRVHQLKIVDWELLRDVLVTSLPASLAGGVVTLQGASYFFTTAALLALVSVLMLFRKAEPQEDAPVTRNQAWMAGALTGLASGLTGVGGGVFLSSLLILLAKVSPKRTAALSPPFISVNSTVALIGALYAGARVPLSAGYFAVVAVLGSIVGTAIGLRWMSASSIRRVLAAILLVGATQMAYRAFS